MKSALANIMCAQDCVKFRGRIACQSFLVSNFANISDVVRVIKSRLGSVVGGGVWNKQHFLSKTPSFSLTVSTVLYVISKNDG